MNYKETLEYLYSQLPVYHRVGEAAYKSGLENMYVLDDFFDHPHRKFRSVHVAGTNGKGSVSHMLASILQEAGYKTALYTSPHLMDYRERIKINGEMIPENEVISFVEQNKSILKSVMPSFFEMSVALAFDFFARSEVEIAVIEVGLGGRLDSTNIITPLMSVITNIGHDHMNLLGDTLEKIAFEKAGIIKKNVPVIIGEIQSETKKVFLDKAEKMASEILFAEDSRVCRLEELDINTGYRRYTLISKENKQTVYGEIPLGGDYQSKNIQSVAASIDILARYFDISAGNLTEGIGKTIINTGLNGRWQIIGKSPLIVCDTGHNKEGLEYVIRQIQNTRKDQLHLIIGFVNDKDLNKVLPLFPHDATYYFTRASVQRALDEKILRSEAARFGLNGESFENVGQAIAKARTNAGKNDMIFIGGSTFVVADALSQF
jgi:dihydrofolate synthase / folylpolyglutamate synthase